MIHLTDQENHTVIDSSPNVKQDDSLLGFCIWIDSSSFAKAHKKNRKVVNKKIFRSFGHGSRTDRA